MTDSWKIPDEEFPMGGTAAEQLRFAARYAILAPSSHNTQPWLFRVVGDTLELRADRTRALPVVDPEDRALVISCGAVLFNLRLAPDAAPSAGGRLQRGSVAGRVRNRGQLPVRCRTRRSCGDSEWPVARSVHGEMNTMEAGWFSAIAIAVYIAVCFGRIARKHGRNPWLYGLLSIVSPVNLIILGCWAFSGAGTGSIPLNVVNGSRSDLRG